MVCLLTQLSLRNNYKECMYCVHGEYLDLDDQTLSESEYTGNNIIGKIIIIVDVMQTM